MLIDTHCHIHEPTYPLPVDEVIARAHAASVNGMICVGTNEQSSRQAVEFAISRDNIWTAVGVHPHDTKEGWGEIEGLLAVQKQGGEGSGSIVAVGEIGLDYFYTHSPREVQIKALEEQMSLALKFDQPIIFHVREAFDDFWPIFDNFSGIRGELHSFTDTHAHMEEALKRGLYIGVNGISTFTKDAVQKAVFARIPLERLLLETDAPFLTPAPFRGKVNEPAFVRKIAEYHAEVRGTSLNEIALATTTNARALFALH